ncbi:MAG: starch-binding protein [Ruminococcaceae bacterium]|nr:starch-binding protein [Oscillospiraceae bacterium]
MKTKKLMSLLLAVLMLFSLLTPMAVSGATEYTDIREELYSLAYTNMIPPGSNYTASSVAAYMDAMDRGKAVFENKYATDEQVQTAIDDIRNALQNLQHVNLDKEAISKVIDRGNEVLQSGIFTKESIDRYKEAYSDAMGAMLYGQSQSEVEEARIKLEAAIDGLVPVAIKLMLGDTDNSDGVNVKDATLIQKYIACLVTLNYRERVVANVDGDLDGADLPNLTIKDATAIQKYIAEVDSECSAQGVEIGEYFMYDLSQEEPDIPETTATTEVTETEPTEPEAFRDIPFEIVSAEKCYYYWGNPWAAEPVFAVADSKDAFYEEWRKIFSESGEQYLLPEDIDDEYFRTHSLILYLSEIGSSSNTKTIDNISVGGDKLIVDRTIFIPEICTDDMCYQFSVIGVNKEDIEGVTKFDERTEDVFESDEDNTTDATEPSPSIPMTYEDIPFTLVDMDRLWGYSGGEEPVFMIADTVQEFHDAWEYIFKDEDGNYLVPDQFDEEYFETHSFLIYISFVGGSTDSQRINKISVSGNKLIVDRTRYCHVTPTPDMNYQYAIVEVNKEDVKGVTEFELNTRYEYYGKEEITTTVPEYDTIDIYFKDTQDWQGIYIFYYSAADYEKYPQWPGVSMELIFEESSGNLYKAAVPADAELIIFNSVYANEQTKEVWAGDFKHGDVFVPVRKVGSQWEVMRDLYVLPEPPDTSEPVTGEREIYFHLAYEDRVSGWESPNDYDMEDVVYLVKSPEMLNNVLDLLFDDISSWFDSEIYNEEFFEDNSLFVAFASLGSGSYSLDYDRLVVEDGFLTIYRTVQIPSGAHTCDMNYRVAVIEVANKDIADVEDFDVVQDCSYEGEIDFTVALDQRVQSWYHDPGDSGTQIFLADSPEKMDEVLSLVHDSADGNNFQKPERGEKYNDEFFEKNSVIMEFVPLSSGSFRQEYKRLVVEENTLCIYRKITSPGDGGTDDMNYRVVFIEVANKDIEGVTDIYDMGGY